MTHAEEIKNRDMALKRARSYARAGNRTWAQIFVDRAQAFAIVSARQVKNVEKLLEKAAETSIV